MKNESASSEVTCENCENFFRHYMIMHNKFMEMNCGHCGKKSSDKRGSRLKVCKHWHSKQQKMQQDKRLIKLNLEDMAIRLDEISQILKARGEDII